MSDIDKKRIKPPTAEQLIILDESYESFPDLDEWLKVIFNDYSWEELKSKLNQHKEEITNELYQKAVDYVVRSTAAETGALEGLYEIDRGITITIAEEADNWEKQADEKDENIRLFLEAQLRAYKLVEVAIIEETPIHQAWICGLHAEICANQDTYIAMTSAGPQSQKLEKGKYKKFPNHVELDDGSVFVYAPVESTVIEMRKLVEILRSAKFESLHPVLQASYAHYGIVRIHPFADGNGRVARAISSMYLQRYCGIPLLIYLDQRDEYLDALESADEGNLEDFVKFVYYRGIDTFLIQINQIRNQLMPSPKEIASELSDLYIAYHEMTHQDLDKAAYALVDFVVNEFNKQVGELNLPTTIEFQANAPNRDYERQPEGFRIPLSNKGRNLGLSFTSVPPAGHNVSRSFLLYISKEESDIGEILLNCQQSCESLRILTKDLAPTLTPLGKELTESWANRIITELLEELLEGAKESLKKSGYR